MVKVLNTIIENAQTKEIRAELFADTKSDDFENISGVPADYKISAGSSVITANGDFAFMNSSGEWIWI